MIRFEDGELSIESVTAAAIVRRVGTPAYVYSSAALTAAYRQLDNALAGTPHRICYSLKANSSLAVIRHFAGLGAGFDIVSAGELVRVLEVGGDPADVVFSGVGKRIDEIDFALKLGIGCFNVESAAELERLAGRAALAEVVAPISIRVNPDIDPRTHPYIATGLECSKFGVPGAQALELYRAAAAAPELRVVGVDCHIGSQINDAAPLIEALDALLSLRCTLEREGISISHVNLGGGLGVRYRDEPDFDLAGYAGAIRERVEGSGITVFLEPGRFLVADAGVLLTRVEYLKPSVAGRTPNFAIVDAAMNDLIRPALYHAWHGVARIDAPPPGTPVRHWQLVGPVCESGDFIAHDRELALAGDEVLAIMSAGAYGFVQSSNYNTRGRAPEVMVENDAFRVVRRRESISDVLRLERRSED